MLTSVYVRNLLIARTSLYFSTTATSLIAWWTANYAPRVPNTINLTAVDFRDLDGEFGVTGTVPAAVAGSNGSTLSAGFAAVLCTLNGSPGAAPRKGRMYVGPIVEADMDAGGDSITAGATTSWQTAMNALEAAATPESADAQVIVSRFLNGTRRAEAVTNTVASVTVSGFAASQTRRRRLR